MWESAEVGHFIKLKAFCETSEFWRPGAVLPSWKAIFTQYPHIIADAEMAEGRRLFLTHRWDGDDHPDPTGWQARAIRQLGQHYAYKQRNLCFWYDFMSLPQKPRNDAEEQIFQSGLKNIRRVGRHCQNVTLISSAGKDHQGDRVAMLNRGWIIFELFIARSTMREPLPLYEREMMPVIDGRIAQHSKNVVVPDLATLAPLDSRESVHAWFVKQGIKCTNGSDLEYLSALLHEELTQYNYDIPPPGVEFGVETSFTNSEIIKFVLRETGLSHRFPNIYLKESKKEFPPVGEELVWTVKFVYRPPLPDLGTWVKISGDDWEAMLVDPKTMTSPMYPGIFFRYEADRSMVRAELA